jgi:membrane protease YdiL (CAAX protease family)
MRSSHKPQIAAEIICVIATVLSVKWLADQMELLGAGSIAMWSGIVVATLLMRRHGTGWRELGWGLPRGRRQWASAIAFALLAVVAVIVFMVFVLDPLTTRLGLETPSDAPDRWAFFLGRPLVFLTYLVVVVWIGAALGEELLMRGFVLNRLADMFGRDKAGWTLAMLVHAVIFGSLHAYQGLPGMLGTGVVALIFALVYMLAKRRLFPLVLGHGLINTISLTAYYLSDGTIT